MTSLDAMTLLRGLLAILAGYHLFIGVVSVTSIRLTARVVAGFYGLVVSGDPALRYAVRMLGLYALVIGTLLAIATWDPAAHRDVIVAVAALQMARALCRLVWSRELKTAFALSPGRNAFNATLLLVESAVLIICMPAIS